ncbi:MAG: sulfotransferase [Pseudomonadota bacterium]
MGAGTVLFCVGATKAGTGWLYERLAEHPDCHFRSIKELHYFSALENGTLDREISKHENRQAVLAKKVEAAGPRKALGEAMRLQDRTEWLGVLTRGEDTRAYLTYLNGGRTTEAVVGDITPAYALLPGTRLKQMAALTPKVRFVYVLRDPVDRIWSHIRMIAARREPSGEVTADRAGRILRRTLRGQESQIARRSDYAGNLARLGNAVGDALCVPFYEDLFSGRGLAQIADHLGIGPFRGPIDAVVHPGQALELLPEQRLALRDWLAPQYEYVERELGPVPDAWR